MPMHDMMAVGFICNTQDQTSRLTAYAVQRRHRSKLICLSHSNINCSMHGQNLDKWLELLPFVQADLDTVTKDDSSCFCIWSSALATCLSLRPATGSGCWSLASGQSSSASSSGMPSGGLSASAFYIGMELDQLSPVKSA